MSAPYLLLRRAIAANPGLERRALENVSAAGFLIAPGTYWRVR
jgi:hypothetical protein